MTPTTQPTPEKSLKMYTEDEEVAAQEAAAKPSIDDRLVSILERLADKQDQGPVSQVPLAKAKFVTPWNPTGERYTEELARPTYMNGRRLFEMTLTQKEITLLNLLKPGRYNNRKWVVIGTDSSSEGLTMQLLVPDKTQEQRIELKNDARNLTELLEKIVAEQSAVKAS